MGSEGHLVYPSESDDSALTLDRVWRANLWRFQVRAPSTPRDAIIAFSSLRPALSWILRPALSCRMRPALSMRGGTRTASVTAVGEGTIRSGALIGERCSLADTSP